MVARWLMEIGAVTSIVLGTLFGLSGRFVEGGWAMPCSNLSFLCTLSWQKLIKCVWRLRYIIVLVMGEWVSLNPPIIAQPDLSHKRNWKFWNDTPLIRDIYQLCQFLVFVENRPNHMSMSLFKWHLTYRLMRLSEVVPYLTRRWQRYTTF